MTILSIAKASQLSPTDSHTHLIIAFEWLLLFSFQRPAGRTLCAVQRGCALYGFESPASTKMTAFRMFFPNPDRRKKLVIDLARPCGISSDWVDDKKKRPVRIVCVVWLIDSQQGSQN